MKYFNTTLGLSMLPDGKFYVVTVDADAAKCFFSSNDIQNIANPTHANSLQAIIQKLGVDVRDAKGGRIRLSSGDQCLIAEISGIPRETREFSDTEIASAVFNFRIVEVL
ncbi:MAG: hypothetical protein V1707_00675 [bacterium]